ncbi:MAG: hypothetical protein V4671_02850 [Armatimonadota bacterium]
MATQITHTTQIDTQTANDREELTARTVAAAELAAAEPGPDEASTALMTSTLRSQGVRPVSSDQEGSVTCPECGTPLVIAPKSGKQYIVCYSALGGEGGCWYHRELPAKKKEKAN